MGRPRKEPTENNAAADEGTETLRKLGKQLLTGQKFNKDGLLKLLKVGAGRDAVDPASLAIRDQSGSPTSPRHPASQPASRILEEAPQSSQAIIQASADLCKATSRAELLKHKDRVRAALPHPAWPLLSRAAQVSIH